MFISRENQFEESTKEKQHRTNQISSRLIGQVGINTWPPSDQSILISTVVLKTLLQNHQTCSEQLKAIWRREALECAASTETEGFFRTGNCATPLC